MLGVGVHLDNGRIERATLTPPAVNFAAILSHALTGTTGDVEPVKGAHVVFGLVIVLIATNSVTDAIGGDGAGHWSVSVGLENLSRWGDPVGSPAGLRCSCQPANLGSRSGRWPMPAGHRRASSTLGSLCRKPIVCRRFR